MVFGGYKMSIVCLGDSLTYGYEVPTSQSWVSQLATLSHWDLINKGIPGETTLDMKRRLNSDVFHLNPSKIIFMGGTNDLFLGRSINEILSTIDEILSTFKAHDLPAILLTPLPINEKVIVKRFFSEADYVKVNQDLNLLRSQLIDYATKHQLKLIDIGNQVFHLPNYTEYFLRDGIHVQPVIYQMIAETIWHALS